MNIKIKDENFMKRKERKNLAQKIAKCESIILHSADSQEISKAQNEIMRLSGCAMSLEDMMEIDILVQEILEKENS